MGGGGSKQAQLDRYGQLLTPGERRALELTFHEIADSQEASAFTEQQLTTYLTDLLFLPATSQSVSRGVFLMLGGGGGGAGGTPRRVTFPDFVLNASYVLRGSVSQRSQRLCLLCSGSLSSMRDVLQAALACMFSDHFPLAEALGLSSWPPSSDSVHKLVDFLTKPLTVEQEMGMASGGSLSEEDIESWLASSPAAGRILDVVFGMSLYHKTIRSSQPPPEVASLVGLPVREETGSGLDTQRVLVPLHTSHPTQRGYVASLLLNPAALLMINSYLPTEVRGQLYPLFISVYHGQSFSTLCKGLVGSGPTVLVIRDTGGHVFGGFAAIPWQFGPQFIGNSECFLFSLHPTMVVYTATGYNTNYMYLQQTAQTMPNGLGMGGQLEYCGLWLSGEFDRGHSRGRPQCTTYGSPSLSSSEEFTVDAVEAWHVGPPPSPDDQEGVSQKSILDKDKVAGHLLEMAGKTRHSEGLREPPEDS